MTARPDESERRGEVRAGRDRGCMEIGSYPIVKGRTCKRATACCTMMARRQHHRGRRSERRTESSISSALRKLTGHIPEFSEMS
jgi:hypothetical protein